MIGHTPLDWKLNNGHNSFGYHLNINVLSFSNTTPYKYNKWSFATSQMHRRCNDDLKNY